MIHFNFGTTVIDQVYEELLLANSFIRIAVFQMHNLKLFSLLNMKLKEGVNVEIFTLPLDAINEDVRERVVDQFKSIEKNGAKIYFCRWNIGNPERTTTADDRWYSYHGKFIVTDKSAITLSANFIDENEIDALLLYRFEQEKINEYNQKFNDLVDLFVDKDNGFDGKIHSLVQEIPHLEVNKLFTLPQTIKSKTHINHWITDYPAELCPENGHIQDKLYLCPFDLRSRSIINALFEKAEKYIFISTESFTDQQIVYDIINKRLSGIEVKLISGTTSMDFSDRVQKLLKQLIGAGVLLKTTEEDLHAKLIISDKHVAVSSINFNKINLGFHSHSTTLWRANTETISITSDPKIIESAKDSFESIFEKSRDIRRDLEKKIEKDIKQVFSNYFRLRTAKEVKALFTRYIINKQINTEKSILKIGQITHSIMEASGRKYVRREEFIMGFVLYLLSENKLPKIELIHQIGEIDPLIDLEEILDILIEKGYIEVENNYYKINLLSLRF